MRWFTSDHHFGHERIIELCDRPFKSVYDMNTQLVLNWNERVAPTDTVYVLGDFAMGRIAETLPLVAQLNGKAILIPGNHDRCWAGEKRAPRRQEWVARYLAAGFAGVYTYDRPLPLILTDNTPALLWHFPYEPDVRGRIELDTMNPIDRGSWLLHGHVHTEWAMRGSDQGSLQLNVGVDTSEVITRGQYPFAPISETEVVWAIHNILAA